MDPGPDKKEKVGLAEYNTNKCVPRQGSG